MHLLAIITAFVAIGLALPATRRQSLATETTETASIIAGHVVKREECSAKLHDKCRDKYEHDREGLCDTGLPIPYLHCDLWPEKEECDACWEAWRHRPPEVI